MNGKLNPNATLGRVVNGYMPVSYTHLFVDGDKRKYIEDYEMVLEKLSPGGYIIADNTLWDGHVRCV